MTCYVDPLMWHGWVMRGRAIQSCHLFTDSQDAEELHRLAATIGLERRWYQEKGGSVHHYDLTPAKRARALGAGAVAVDRRQAVAIWRAWRAARRAAAVPST